MLPQIIELIVFAVVLFLLINKLMSILGTTTSHSPRKGFFSGGTIKDVTSSAEDENEEEVCTSRLEHDELIHKVQEYVDNSTIAYKLLDVFNRVDGFDCKQFIDSVRQVFNILINRINIKAKLLDPRFEAEFKSIAHKYGDVINVDSLNIKIADIYFFGNITFIKVKLTGQNVVSNMPLLNEEWTFCKSTAIQDPAWYLSNIIQGNDDVANHNADA